jgi:predicted nucleic acid-binding protein
MSNFKDSSGYEWSIDLKIQHIEAVKKLCRDQGGHPVDLLELIEKGILDQLLSDINLLIEIVFVICYEQSKEQFNVADYDTEKADMYEMIPEWKKESNMKKASRWFSGRIDGATLYQLIEAFQDALIDFFPSESRKAALRKIIAKSKELELIQDQEIETQINEMFPMVTEKIRNEAKRVAQESLSGLLSGNTPVLLEQPQDHSR